MENKGNGNLKWILSSFAPPYAKVSECLHWEFHANPWVLTFLFLLCSLSLLSLKKKYIREHDLSYKGFFFPSVHIREMFCSFFSFLMCFLTVNHSVLCGTVSASHTALQSLLVVIQYHHPNCIK